MRRKKSQLSRMQKLVMKVNDRRSNDNYDVVCWRESVVSRVIMSSVLNYVFSSNENYQLMRSSWLPSRQCLF